MRRLLPILAALVAACLAGALIARAGAPAGPAGFRTPDASAACHAERTAVVCSSLGAKASIALPQRGAAHVVSELPWWDASTRVLHARWHDGSITCTASGAAIICRNARTAISVDARGFAVAS